MFRSLLASQLVEEYGFSEVDVARRLGITQAAVSQYVHAKRARRKFKKPILRREVENMARTAALRMSKNRMSPDDLARMTCALCAKLDLRGPLGKG